MIIVMFQHSHRVDREFLKNSYALLPRSRLKSAIRRAAEVLGMATVLEDAGLPISAE